MHHVEAGNDELARELAAENEELQPRADHRGGPNRTVQESQASSREQVIWQGVAEEALEDAQGKQGNADRPVELPRLAERAGEEDPEAVHQHGGDEEHGRPVMHLPEQQPAANVERQAQRRGVRLGHRQTAEQLVGAVVLDLRHRGHEPDREEDAGEQADDEGVERDLTQQERPVVREDLAEERPEQASDADPLVGPLHGPPRNPEDRAYLFLRNLGLDSWTTRYRDG